MVREVMGVTYKEWVELKEIVIKIGHLTYTKSSLEQQQVSIIQANAVVCIITKIFKNNSQVEPPEDFLVKITKH